VDDRSNSLIVTDISDKLDQVDAMVRNLDTRTPQVEIVARLVDVDQGHPEPWASTGRATISTCGVRVSRFRTMAST